MVGRLCNVVCRVLVWQRSSPSHLHLLGFTGSLACSCAGEADTCPVTLIQSYERDGSQRKEERMSPVTSTKPEQNVSKISLTLTLCTIYCIEIHRKPPFLKHDMNPPDVPKYFPTGVIDPCPSLCDSITRGSGPSE